MKFNLFIRRAFEALQISSQNKLAIHLGINRTGITRAKKLGTAPDKWIPEFYRHDIHRWCPIEKALFSYPFMGESQIH